MEQSIKPIIVVVDDNTAIHQLYELATSSMEVDLLLFSSADDAMAFLKDNQPDLLFLDIIMPEKDGLTFLKELRQLDIHQNTKVIMVSGKNYDQDKSIARKLGAIDFLIKPAPSKDLQALIQTHLNI